MHSPCHLALFSPLLVVFCLQSLRVVVPVGPRIPITSLMDGYERSWFDNLSTTPELREDDEEDVYGIEKVRSLTSRD